MRITRRGFIRTGLVGGAGIAAAGAYGFAYERNRVVVTRADAPCAGLPAVLDGLRVGILTDLHHSALVSQQHIQDAARILMAEHPDVVVLLGDYVSWADRRYVGSCAEALGGLSAPYGVFAIVGNHDDERAMPRALAARGFQALLDARTDLRIRDEAIALAGMRFWSRRDMRHVLAGSPRPMIMLAHDPRRFTEALDAGVSLVLSGHTHGGQVVLPLVGAVMARKYPIAQGLLVQGRSALFVSRGVGTVLVPVRLNCPPEAAVVTLRAVRA